MSRKAKLIIVCIVLSAMIIGRLNAVDTAVETDSAVHTTLVLICNPPEHLDCEGADLTGRDLSEMDLNSAKFSNSNLTNANLTNANLSNVSLIGANLRTILSLGSRTPFQPETIDQLRCLRAQQMGWGIH